jgi:nucleotide-binding universal stress UspA family protein
MISTLLILLDPSPATLPRIDLAVALASKHGAAIIGAFLPPGLHSGDDKELQPMQEAFFARAESAGVKALWYDLSGSPEQFWRDLLHIAHCSSLIIIGQTDGEAEVNLPTDMSERLLAAAGRPLITVPFAVKRVSCGERVLVAWSDGRESARALHDAMPILSLAQKVHLVKLITDETLIDGAAERLSLVTDHLLRSGIKAKGDILLSLDFPAGDMLLNRACDEGCDLLVMGAVRESGGKITAGKVAKHVLQHLTVPVLMSH